MASLNLDDRATVRFFKSNMAWCNKNIFNFLNIGIFLSSSREDSQLSMMSLNVLVFINRWSFWTAWSFIVLNERASFLKVIQYGIHTFRCRIDYMTIWRIGICNFFVANYHKALIIDFVLWNSFLLWAWFFRWLRLLYL
jgi:hypothetical protein